MGWELGKELGSGHFAKVYLVTRKSDGIQSACKIIKKPKGARGAAHAPSRNSLSAAPAGASSLTQHTLFSPRSRRAQEARSGGDGA